METAINSILTALASGVAAGGQNSTNVAVQAIYRSLKTLIRQKCSERQDAQSILSEYELAPAFWKERLKNVLVGAHADQDRDIVLLAQKLSHLLPREQRAGRQMKSTRLVKDERVVADQKRAKAPPYDRMVADQKTVIIPTYNHLVADQKEVKPLCMTGPFSTMRGKAM